VEDKIRMEIITRKYNGKPHQFKVYTESEAKARSLEYVHWKLASKEPWAITDDGYVAEVLAVKFYTERGGRTRKYVILSIGKNFVTNSNRIEYLRNKEVNDYSNIIPRTWIDAEIHKKRTKNTVKVYVQQLLNGAIDFKELGKVFRPKEAIPEASVKRLLKQDKVKHMIDQEIERICKEKGINKEFVLDTIKEAIEIAKQRQDPSNMLKGADQLQDYLDFFPKSKAPNTWEMGITQELAGQVDAIDKELEGKVPVSEEVARELPE
jgi:hypothetical protein